MLRGRMGSRSRLVPWGRCAPAEQGAPPGQGGPWEQDVPPARDALLEQDATPAWVLPPGWRALPCQGRGGGTVRCGAGLVSVKGWLGAGRFSGCMAGLEGVSTFAAGLFISGLDSAAGRAGGRFAAGIGLVSGADFVPAVGMDGCGRASFFAIGCITGAGLIPRSAGIGLVAAIVAGLPWLTEANCARLLAEAFASCTCAAMGGAWGARKAATSAGLGRACTPCGPPL